MLVQEELTKEIISAFYQVYNKLGYGFLEKVYENALYIELSKRNLAVDKQKKIEVFYYESLVGEYYADLVVNNSVIIELKAASSIVEEHEFQLINYLKATRFEIGLLLNFGRKPEFKRKIYSNMKK